MKLIKKIAYLCFVAALAFSCNPKGADAEKADGGDDLQEIFPVRTRKMKMQAVTRTIEYTANLMAFKEIHYAPASPGRINKIHVEVGDRVRKGRVLVESDRTQLMQAKTQLASARDNFKRIDTLYALGSISEQQYEQSKTQFELAQSNVDFLKENTTLTSPINGIVTGKYFENGELYAGAPNTAAGKSAIISLMQIDPLKAEVSISQSQYPFVKEGQMAKIHTDILPDSVFSGKITKVFPTIDPMTRTFKTEILIDNPRETLRPGMFASITIEIQEEEALLVPAIAVLKQSGTNNRFVFIHDQGVARKVEVQVGKRFDDLLEVRSAQLHEGVDLIVDGQARLLDGFKIRVLDK